MRVVYMGRKRYSSIDTGMAEVMSMAVCYSAFIYRTLW